MNGVVDSVGLYFKELSWMKFSKAVKMQKGNRRIKLPNKL